MKNREAFVLAMKDGFYQDIHLHLGRFKQLSGESKTITLSMSYAIRIGLGVTLTQWDY